MIIAVASLSEPVATTALAVRVAAECAQVHGDGFTQVLLVTTSEVDPMHDALDRRGWAGDEREVPTAVLPSARALQMLVPRMAQDYDDIVIDVSGINTPAVRTALTIADRVVVPVASADAAADGPGMTCAESDFREFVMTVDMARYYNARLVGVAVTDGAGAPAWLVDLLATQPGWHLASSTRLSLTGATAAPGRSPSGLAADPVVASVA